MLGISMLVILMAAMVFAGWRLARGWTWGQCMVGVTVSLLLGLAFFQWAYDSVWVVALFPPRMLPFAAEWQIPLVAFGAGIFLRDVKLPFWRRAMLSLVLVAVSLLPLFKMVNGRTPRSKNVWSGEVCRQTNPATCSAAAAATLLGKHGIKATEGEMIDLCYTRKDGTSLGGTARGLDIKARSNGKQVKVGKLTVGDLKAGAHLPALLFLHLRQSVADREPRYEEQWGWTVGFSHAVVIFGFTSDGLPIIGDPSVGREVWSVKGLEELWTGTTVWLE
ncbi:MAG: hypothetical protein K0Q55_1968 [Verrucomicrobia bacterium]|jgi:hypothetical protein|nr:hypothetical protein [Verrucomicrobiota bacterium]